MPTITQNGQYQDAAGIRLRRIGRYTGPVSYATGGDSFTASNVSLGVMQFANFGMAYNGSNAMRLLYWDPSTSKVIWYIPSTGAEVAALQDLSTFTCTFEVVGK